MPSEKIFYHIFENVTDTEQLTPLVSSIALCMCSAFENELDPQKILDRMLGEYVVLALNEKATQVVGFTTSGILDHEVNGSVEKGWYLNTAVVSKESQNKGIYKEMNRRRIQQALNLHLPFVFTRTQNPRVEEGIRAILNDFQEQGGIEGYSLEREKLDGVYRRMLTPQVPVGKYTQYDELDHSAGDAYYLVFLLHYPAAQAREAK